MKLSEIPSLKLFVILSVFTLLFSYLGLSNSIILSLSVCSLAIGLVSYYLKYFGLSYLFVVISISTVLSQNMSYFDEFYPTKIIPEENGTFIGEIKHIQKSEENYFKYIAEGNLNSENLPTIKNCRILLLVFRPKIGLYPGEYFQANVKINFPEPEFPGSNYSTIQYMKGASIDFQATTNGYEISVLDKVNIFTRYSFLMRKNLTKRIYEIFDSNSAAVMTALLTGDKSMISKEIKDNFIMSGTAHLLAVSGLHVGIISFLIFVLMGFIQNKWIKTLSIIFLIFLFVFMTGFLTSGLRAAVMISVYLITKNIERRINPLNSIGFAGLILFIINPDILFSVSFQMSFLSVLSILAFYPSISTKFRELLPKKAIIHKISDSFALTISSSVLISPIVAYYFGIYSLISPFTNLVVVPLMLLSMSFGIAALFASLISMNLAGLFGLSSSFLINLSDSINILFLDLPFSYIKGDIAILESILFSIAIVYVIFYRNRQNFIFRVSVSILIILSIHLYDFKKEKRNLEIIPRQNLTVLTLTKNSNDYVLIFDRKSRNSTRKDFSLLKYLENNQNKLKIGVTGNSGIATIDVLKKKKKKFDDFELNIENQKRIIKLLKLGDIPSKLIEY